VAGRGCSAALPGGGAAGWPRRPSSGAGGEQGGVRRKVWRRAYGRRLDARNTGQQLFIGGGFQLRGQAPARRDRRRHPVPWRGARRHGCKDPRGASLGYEISGRAASGHAASGRSAPGTRPRGARGPGDVAAPARTNVLT
jgi:hypothetical protein